MESSNQTQIVKIEPLELNGTYFAHPMIEKNGAGLTLKSESGFISTLASFITKLGGHVLTGNFDLAALVPPSSVMVPYVLLQMYMDNFQYGLKFFKKAALETKDPVERLKLITAGLIADISTPLTISNGSPPIPAFPGEYLEGIMADGTYIK